MLKNKINGKVYIGQTIRPVEKRFEEHKKKTSGCVAIYNAIQYHGWDNFEKDWYECPDEDLNFDEELLVREMGTLGPGGYNLREGGGNHGKMSEESKQKMSKVRIGIPKSEETRQKMREAQQGEHHPMFGKNHSEETRGKMSEAQRGEHHPMFGKTHSEETIKKMSEAKRGKKHPMYGIPKSEETKQKLSEAKQGETNYKSKRVYQYDLDGTFINSFGSCGEAGRFFKKAGSGISMCANSKNKQKTAYGFKWSYIKF